MIELAEREGVRLQEAVGRGSKGVHPVSSGSEVSLSELISALSFALDLVEDAKPGHAVRTCLLGMQMAAQMRLPVKESADLYYALLLKDVGCSSNARVLCDMVGGDDRKIKRESKLEDWTRASFSGVKLLWRNSGSASMPDKLRRMVKMAVHHDQSNAKVIGMRCERGAQIVRKIGLSDQTAEAIRSLDEHWDGSGHPDRLVGEQIPLLARIMNLAQHLDIFATEQSQRAALQVMKDRSGRWFDPDLVRVAGSLAAQGLLWLPWDAGNERQRVLEMEPGQSVCAGEYQIDNIAEAFADIVDAKSSFTFRHSVGVTAAAMDITKELGLNAERSKVIYRAALLHDLGKLRVPNTILDKPSKLDDVEWKVVQEHPGLTRDILKRVSIFSEIADIGGKHHEKLDGSGYPFRLKGDELSLESRILTVADIYGALHEDRPYRGGLSMETIRGIMSKEVPHKLDQNCFEALMASLSKNNGKPTELQMTGPDLGLATCAVFTEPG